MPFDLSGIKSRIYRSLGAKIGEHVYFAYGAFIFVSDFKKLKVGDGVTFGRNVKINCEELEIGDDTHISWGVTAVGTLLKIGKRGAWIPAGVFIMPGVTIGEKATVGARSLIIHDVPDGSLAVGIPAAVIKTAEENKREVSFEEKDRMVRDIIDEYLWIIRKRLRIFSENKHFDGSFLTVEIESKEKENFFGRKKRWALLYTKNVFNRDQMDRLRGFCKKFHLILLISLASIPTNVIESLSDTEFNRVVWFSVEDKMRKTSWNKDVLALHNFFRSRYGIRFKFFQGKR